MATSNKDGIMDARTRVLTALDCGIPDRIPCALGIYPVGLKALLPDGVCVNGGIDLAFVHFDPSPDEEKWRRTARITPDDTRLGTTREFQINSELRYNYRQLNIVAGIEYNTLSRSNDEIDGSFLYIRLKRFF